LPFAHFTKLTYVSYTSCHKILSCQIDIATFDFMRAAINHLTRNRLNGIRSIVAKFLASLIFPLTLCHIFFCFSLLFSFFLRNMQMKVRLQCSKNWTELSWAELTTGSCWLWWPEGVKGALYCPGGVAEVLPFPHCNDNDQDNEDALVVKGKWKTLSATKNLILLRYFKREKDRLAIICFRDLKLYLQTSK